LNSLQITLVSLFGLFVLLYLALPGGHRLAFSYLRYLVLALAATLVLSPFYWLICAAFKDSEVLMTHTFMPPLSEWFSRSDLKEADISNWAELGMRLQAEGAGEDKNPAARVYQYLTEAERTEVKSLADEAVALREEFNRRRAAMGQAEEAEPESGGQYAETLREQREKLAALEKPVIKAAMLAGLQRALADPDFYQPEYFMDLKRIDEFEEYKSGGLENVKGDRRMRMNRMLLEAVFPDSVRRSRTLNLYNYKKLFTPSPTQQGTIYFWRYILNSLFLAGASTMIHLFFSSLCGYALAKYQFRGRNILVFYMLGTMMVPHILLLAPLYKIIVDFGWIDTYYALLVPGAVSVFGIFLFRQAILGVPDDLIEAGRIDGCGEFRIYLNLVMPLVRPMTGAFCLVSFMGSWNAFLGPQIFIHSQNNLTLPVILNQYMGVYNQEYGVFLAGTLLAIIPPAILFFALQKEFISGLTKGAVKG
jgi:ABC-type glycerol-3-phosphate transport system permease component